MTTFISKETISRLLKDVKHILKNGPEQAQSSLDDPDFSFDATQRPDLRYA